tara:strand:- start:629 stop:814 length:186 start_codon:yes stop_codon:yes gene_type:complete
MKKDQVQELINLRTFLVEHYGRLDGKTSPGTAIIKQADVAYVYETAIKTIDDMLKDHVKFE